MDKMVKVALDHAGHLLERIKIYEIIIQSFIAQGRLPEAVSTAIEILNQLGVTISKKPSRIFVMLNVLRVQAMLRRMI